MRWAACTGNNKIQGRCFGMRRYARVPRQQRGPRNNLRMLAREVCGYIGKRKAAVRWSASSVIQPSFARRSDRLLSTSALS